MPTEVKIRLLVADDQEMVRQGVKALLAGTDIKVVAEVASGQAAAKHALETDVNVVLLGRPHARRRRPYRPGPHQAR